MSLNPYAYALAERDPATVMAETPQKLAKLLVSLSKERIENPPAPGKWSVREILAHLADCELAFGFRLRQARAGERMVQPFEQDDWAQAYNSYTTELALHTFLALRAWNVAFVRTITEAEKQLPVTHPERGDMMLWTIVETIAGHDLHHLQSLEALTPAPR